MTLFLKIGLAQLLVGWVSGGVRDGDVGFHASTQPTLIFYLEVLDGLVVV
ncbi:MULTISPECIES: hypothetical protein [Cylindrospermopsis]|nr:MULTISPECIES: hypothetical protein [Cylindrospermopsis]